MPASITESLGRAVSADRGARVAHKSAFAPGEGPQAGPRQRLVRLLAWTLCLAVSACGTFSSDPRVRTPGTQLDDEALEKVVERQIRRSDPDFDSAHLVIVSYNSVVLLLGQVESEALKARAQEVTQDLAKVRRVHNELGVGGPISYVARLNDGNLTAKVKTKLIGAKNVPGRKIKVQTENGVVYLMGILTREEADQAVEIAKTAYGVQKIVRVFEYLD